MPSTRGAVCSQPARIAVSAGLQPNRIYKALKKGDYPTRSQPYTNGRIQQEDKRGTRLEI